MSKGSRFIRREPENSTGSLKRIRGEQMLFTNTRPRLVKQGHGRSRGVINKGEWFILHRILTGVTANILCDKNQATLPVIATDVPEEWWLCVISGHGVQCQQYQLHLRRSFPLPPPRSWRFPGQVRTSQLRSYPQFQPDKREGQY